eukprot:CAMPEP_0201480162 /NCGR_PEP_ID=MMETSP0151_2-20130828/4697_1 /ASSEMBLY_ACC=CAM_ASM_000257 /TAXON_ID=200890 /ORGANISM="Paramoeba atlantica, Strain 621/1 / CCAP 1560/9" /LENGTH=1086 /DNA_ID=CAMNT_0047861931 /DNA_START=42 /DNA_END=3302 /DNA_ORIENTATION=-
MAADLTRKEGVRISVMLSEEEKYFMNKNSRQFDTLGGSAMQNFPKASILVVGMGGVGTETAKNLVLAGPGRVVIHDDDIVTPADLGVSFLLTKEHVGQPRAAASLPGLVELNLDMKVESHSGEITKEFLSEFVAVVVTNYPPFSKLVEWNEHCRANNITFVLAQSTGAFASIFSDFGPKHLVTDLDGENVMTHNIQTIKRSESGEGEEKVSDLILEVTADSHGLDDENVIQISSCVGMEELNGKQCTVNRVYQKREGADGKMRDVLDPKRLKVTHVNGEKFSGLKSDSEYLSGGIFSQVKPQKEFEFKGLSESSVSPLAGDGPFMFHPNGFEAMFANRSEKLHFARLALWRFQDGHNGELPRLHNEEDGNEVVDLAEAILKEHQSKDGSLVVEELDKEMIKKIALYSRAELLGLCTFLGGFAAQEVIKKWGKTTPVHQWLHVDFLPLLADKANESMKPEGSRYDHQISFFGKEFQEKLGNQKWFLVGCGALGCEYLKGFSLMGIGSGNEGLLHVTDYDHIELSNLTRQLLFRKEDLKKPKSVVGAKRAQMINPDIKVVVHEARVGPDTEDRFSDKFYNSLDGVCNALDNIKARQYTDSRVVFFEKPLLESGTLGTKCNSEIVIPHKTKCYRDDKDDETAQDIPLCTLRLFPSMIEHCLEWSRSEFAALFVNIPKDVNSFLENKEQFMGDAKLGPQKAGNVKKYIDLKSKGTYEAALLAALDYFNGSFNFNIRDLTWSYPRDAVKKDKDGKEEGPFWSGAKRFPRAADLDVGSTLDMEFLLSASNLFADVIGLPPVNDMNQFLDIFKKLNPEQAKWNAPSKKVDDLEGEKEVVDSGELDGDLKGFLDSFDVSSFSPLVVADFEKDDDTNYHIDFIAASANMRAWNYEIDLASRHKCKMIAGRITPALATTTALITGLVEIEFCKLLLGHPKDQMLAANCNLALPYTVNFFEPDDPIKKKTEYDVTLESDVKPVPEGFTVWDKVVIEQGNLTIREFLDLFPKIHHGVQPGMLTFPEEKEKLLWSAPENVAPAAGKMYAERESRNLLEVYEEIYGPLNPGLSYVVLEASIAEDEAGELVSVPVIKYHFA